MSRCGMPPFSDISERRGADMLMAAGQDDDDLGAVEAATERLQSTLTLACTWSGQLSVAV